MPTFTVPTIDENGITVPIYDVVHEEWREAYRGIYGQDIYIEPDSQDGQLLAIFATAIYDYFSVALAVYNAQSPSTARGVGLSRVVKINGIQRHIPSRSSVDVVVTGQAGTTITGGIVATQSGTRWLLPESVIIPPAGEIAVTATAEALGAVQAGPGEITEISTPTRGFQSVTNPLAAVAGAPVESDLALRQRQTVSTALPSNTVLEGIVGAVSDIEGVTRYAAYENDTDVTDVNGIPEHSISLIVEGGDTTTIAETIAAKKGPGAGTYGTTSHVVVDDFGIPRTIKFYRPTIVPISVVVNLKAKAGYTTNVEALIKQTIADYISSLAIGEDVIRSRVYVPANLSNSVALGSNTFEIDDAVTGIQISRDGGVVGSNDVVIAFNEAASATSANVTINVVP